MRNSLILAAIFSLAIASFAAAETPSPAKISTSLTPSQLDYWSLILHYHRGKSRADGAHFFLSPQGKTNPLAEMQADIAAFQNPQAQAGWFHYHPQCVFRERYAFLKAAGLLKNIPERACPEFDQWKRGLNATSVSLVFSSSYPNNPSSLFGHTLIRLNPRPNSAENPNALSDYAVAFTAVPESDDIGAVYAYKGMTGGYKGLLEVSKYYTKVNEYNHSESRDLIEYDLFTTPAELDRLINHLWEVYQTTYFDYYFLDENCSSVLADILAVAFFPQQMAQHDRWYYLPSEMVKHLYALPGRVLNVHHRPSLKKQWEQTLAQLSPQQVAEVRSIVAHPPTTMPRDLPTLEGAIGLLNFELFRTKNQLSPTQKTTLRQLLIARSKMHSSPDSNITASPATSPKNLPHLGHLPQKLSLFTRTEKNLFATGLEFKNGHHDLMSQDDGYDPFSHFDFFTFSLLYQALTHRLTYDRIVGVSLTSFHPYTFYDPQLSWSARLSSERIFDLPSCQLCHKLNAKAYVGPSINPFSPSSSPSSPSSSSASRFSLGPHQVLALMAGVFAEVSHHFGHHPYRFGPGLEGSYFLQLGDRWKSGLVGEWRINALTTHELANHESGTAHGLAHYRRLTFQQSYFSGPQSEWRFESTAIGRYGRSRLLTMPWQTWVNQLQYGYYF
jgi:hypothetical protein